MSSRRRRFGLAGLGAGLVVVVVLGAFAANASPDETRGAPQSPTLQAASPYLQGALTHAGHAVDVDAVKSLGRTSTGEELFLGPSPDGRMECFMVVDPPETKPFPGTSLSCGMPETVKSRGQEIWRDNPDGSISLWVLGAEGAGSQRSARVRFGSRDIAGDAKGVISTRIPAGVSSIDLTSGTRTETVTVPGR
ncbi:hypothetical protein [Miltoncostaea oceani]|uniref:hypothetical protein n=1 Tax=Miltoncostaea oceani TaxID=2843216 RepID=UPI001C3E0A25|nr:hypothetical protein [Miltoncostaea oceani]